jgi:hypothetical protein
MGEEGRLAIGLPDGILPHSGPILRDRTPPGYI